jgi:hypothetical protein
MSNKNKIVKSIRVGKYDFKTKKEPVTGGFDNILIHTTGSLSPYVMKDKDKVIMENFWQFSKVWSEVDDITQPLSRYQPNLVRWKHPKETHINKVDKDDKPVLTPEYWAWRKKGMTNIRWVRYPNGWTNHSKTVCSIVGTVDNYEKLDYIAARKKIYFAKYREIAIKTKMFKDLKKRVSAGEKIQINEVDGPSYDKDVHPYNKVKNGSLEITEQTLIDLINNPKQAFGHGYALAACLLDLDLRDV